MRSFHFFIIISLLLASLSTFADLPTCRYVHWDTRETAINENAGIAVILDDRLAPEGHGDFQIWDLKTKNLQGTYSLPYGSDKILGFVDSDTVVFASTIYPRLYALMRYHISTAKTETSLISDILTLQDYSVAANFAFASNYGWWSSIDLTSGKSQKRTWDVVMGWSGEIPKSSGAFTADGSAYYNVYYCGSAGGCPSAALTISRWKGPQFLEKERELVTTLSKKDIGMDDLRSDVFAWSTDVSPKGTALVTAVDVENRASNQEFRNIYWIDLTTGKRTVCAVPRQGLPTVQVVDENKKMVFFQGDAVGYHLNALVDMNSCQMKTLPAMDGLQPNRPTRVASIPGRKILYSIGGIWDLGTGSPVIRTCK